MKLNKFAYLYLKPLGNHTLKIMKKYLEIYFKKTGKIMEISWNFVSLKKWEPWINVKCKSKRNMRQKKKRLLQIESWTFRSHTWHF